MYKKNTFYNSNRNIANNVILNEKQLLVRFTNGTSLWPRQKLCFWWSCTKLDRKTFPVKIGWKSNTLEEKRRRTEERVIFALKKVCWLRGLLVIVTVASVELDGGSQKEGLVTWLQFWSRDKSNTHNLSRVNQFKNFICEAHDLFITFKYLHRGDIIDFF